MGFPLTPPDELARELNISSEAVELARASPFLDLHVDSFIWTRIFGYDLNRPHTQSYSLGRFGGHLDFPRAVDAGLSGSLYVITTNPFRRARKRWEVFQKNLRRLNAAIDGSNGAVRVATTYSEYAAAVEDGAHAALPKIQGGNALHPDAGYAHGIEGDAVTCVTVVHLTHSYLGRSSTPLPGWSGPGLTKQGHELVRSLNERRVFVDLAHIHPTTFWDVLRTHDKSQPLIDTHTGCSGVLPHWRNLDDEQLRAIADTGGVIGIIFEPGFLRRPDQANNVERIVDHLAHVVDTVGEDFAAIGSDYDGMIRPPPGLRDGRAFPCLVQSMLDRGWSDLRIRKILGENFLRSFKELRP